MTKFAKLNYSEVESQKINDFKTEFVLQPLERGFGNTIGNAIRRVLLSSIPGVSSFATKISGVDHEFQTIPGVTEDTVKLILNLKNIRFVFNEEIFEEDEVIKVSLKAPKGDVTANDFILPAGVEIVNTDEHIATTSKNDALELELFITVGRGYRTFEENKLLAKDLSSKIESKLKSGKIITIDSDFSPVVNVSYDSVELNSSSTIIEEKLSIRVTTDGTVEAKDAIAKASNILINHLNILHDVSNLSQENVFEDISNVKESVSNKSVPISSLDLSVRSYNCLKRAGYETLEDLSKLTLSDLSMIKNLGKKSVDEIIEKLTEYDVILVEGA